MAELDSLREPDHTGSNRCWPCTLVNACLVVLFVLWLRVRNRRLASLAVATVGVAAIYLRGYVVPYTPQFAPRLVAASPLPNELFHDADVRDPESERESLAETDLDGETVLSELAAAGVVEADGEMLLLTEDVDDAWHEEMAHLSTLSLSALADETRRTLDTVSETDTFTDGAEWVVIDGELVGRPVVVAELAAYRVLDEYVDDESVRLAGAASFRMFLDECPVCETPLAESSEVSCCGGYTKPNQSPDDILVCPACEQRLFTFPSE
ncbi:hypothetical protein EGH21_09460 [Halomicroarcula sp. F13]|uniref:Uncharacterized protein n=1 Tax=Haloarcula rubra TaxID=2487747 RepID=A0AAW4PQ09_9EURY|nr:hypothetical protein [Halomicroarcula rubra]MBX0323256.1 hypothetical protein [Halomicroarcula rubra]